MYRLHDKRLERTVTVIAAVIAAAVALLLPALYFAQARTLLEREVMLKAKVKAELVGQLAARATDSWHFQDTRLIELLRRAPADIGEDAGRILDSGGAVVIRLSDVGGIAYWNRQPVRDAGALVGYVEIGRSTAPLFARAAALVLLGLALAAVFFVTLRSLPLRALRAATGALETHLRYAEKVARYGGSALAHRSASDLIQDAVQTVLEGLSADAVAYVEIDRAKRELLLRAVAGLRSGPNSAALPCSGPELIGPVLEEGKTVILGSVAAESAALPFEWARGLRSAALVPVGGRERVGSALCAMSAGPAAFDPQAGRFVESIASLLAAGLHRLEGETRLAFLAQFDALTGLPNRALLIDRFAQALARAKRHRSGVGVLFIDLDEFKSVNDSLGHAGGDELLKETARRLQSVARAGDTVARISGDEFAMILADGVQPQDAAPAAQRAIEAVAQPFVVREQEVFMTASVGIAAFPEDGDNVEGLLAAADAAMYRAKQAGRNGYQFFTAEIDSQSRERTRLLADLRRALERDEFLLFYQPQIALATRAPVRAEALLRWRHPERGIVSPLEFVPLLEETGHIIEVGEWVLRRAGRDIKAWRSAGVAPLPVAVNLSARQFRQPNLDVRICSLIASEAVEPSLIELEITESHLMQDPDQAIRVMKSLGEAGIRIAIDDFGTGYSSLAYLTRFPVKSLKIDRSFIANIDSEATDCTIVRTIIEMAQVLGLTVVAEGVETAAQASLLQRLGCQEAQGYLYARPMPFGDLRAFLSAHSAPDGVRKTDRHRNFSVQGGRATHRVD